MKVHIAALSLLTILCLALSAPAFASDLYNNGPINGTSGAYLLNTTYQVSDSFTVGPSLTISAFTFAEWLPAGTTPSTVEWEIGTTPFGSDVSNGGLGFLTATILPTNVAPVCSAGSIYNGGLCGAGVDDVVNSTVVFASSLCAAGTCWLTLTNAIDSASTHDGWDINSGPSTAYHSLFGAVPSESFTIYDGPAATTPEPGSIMLLGSGILGLAGLLRRELL